jgi:hypothetical protein
MKKSFLIRKIAGVILIAAAAIFLFTFIVMSLWNSILAPVLGVRIINFGQALGILILSKILFGGFRGGSGWRGRRGAWNNQMKEKWQTMSPEEKEKFKNALRNRCSRGYRSSAADKTSSDNTTAEQDDLKL